MHVPYSHILQPSGITQLNSVYLTTIEMSRISVRSFVRILTLDTSSPAVSAHLFYNPYNIHTYYTTIIGSSCPPCLRFYVCYLPFVFVSVPQSKPWDNCTISGKVAYATVSPHLHWCSVTRNSGGCTLTSSFPKWSLSCDEDYCSWK